jgi:exonuclease III
MQRLQHRWSTGSPTIQSSQSYSVYSIPGPEDPLRLPTSLRVNSYVALEKRQKVSDERRGLVGVRGMVRTIRVTSHNVNSFTLINMLTVNSNPRRSHLFQCAAWDAQLTLCVRDRLREDREIMLVLSQSMPRVARPTPRRQEDVSNKSKEQKQEHLGFQQYILGVLVFRV